MKQTQHQFQRFFSILSSVSIFSRRTDFSRTFFVHVFLENVFIDVDVSVLIVLYEQISLQLFTRLSFSAFHVSVVRKSCQCSKNWLLTSRIRIFFQYEYIQHISTTKTTNEIFFVREHIWNKSSWQWYRFLLLEKTNRHELEILNRTLNMTKLFFENKEIERKKYCYDSIKSNDLNLTWKTRDVSSIHFLDTRMNYAKIHHVHFARYRWTKWEKWTKTIFCVYKFSTRHFSDIVFNSLIIATYCYRDTIVII